MTMQPWRQCAVYAITSGNTGRRYIGGSVNYRARWSAHRGTLRKGSHKNPALQEAWNSEGESAFVFEVLELVASADALLAREQYWLDQPHEAGLFNHAPLAGTLRGSRKTAEAKARVAAAKRGEKNAAARLCSSDVLAIRAAVRRGEAAIDVARRFGVSPANVGLIVRRQTWKHIHDAPIHQEFIYG